MNWKSWTALVLVGFCAASLQAHVGSPDVYLEGKAGPYRLWVTIRPPEVIPGVAAIEVRTEARDFATKLEVTPTLLAEKGTQFAPSADVMRTSPEDPNFYTGSLWIMRPGSWQIRLHAFGRQGDGTLAVPIPAMATRIKGMQRGLGLGLLAMMSTLVIGLVAIAGASADEATRAPGMDISSSHRLKSRLSMLVTTLAVLSILAFGRHWWNQSEVELSGTIYKPMQMKTTQMNGVLSLHMSDPGWLPLRKVDDLILDHNHLMHLYAIREPGLDVMFHLHPELTGPGQFRLALPSMPAGSYRLYADIVHENGFPETLASSLTLASDGVTKRPLIGDDATGVAAPVDVNANLDDTFHLPDGCTMVWVHSNKRLRAKQLNVFEFRLLTPQGQAPQDMQLYMGMLGHAAFVKTDFTTFAHIHPDGSVNMSAYMMAQQEKLESSVDGRKRSTTKIHLMDDRSGMHAASEMQMDMSGENAPPVSNVLPNRVSFPYGFPQPGHYRVFVQVRKGRTIETGAFDASVQ